MSHFCPPSPSTRVTAKGRAKPLWEVYSPRSSKCRSFSQHSAHQNAFLAKKEPYSATTRYPPLNHMFLADLAETFISLTPHQDSTEKHALDRFRGFVQLVRQIAGYFLNTPFLPTKCIFQGKFSTLGEEISLIPTTRDHCKIS